MNSTVARFAFCFVGTCVAGFTCGLPLAAGQVPSFKRTYVDQHYGGNGRPGWVRADDVDLDGDLDIVAGGGRALFIYANDPSDTWSRFGSLDGTRQMGANGAVLMDVDGDGESDVVSAKFEGDIGWWENPGGTLSSATWAFHAIAESNGGYLHDIVAADVDRDGARRELIAVFNHGSYFKSKIDLRLFSIPTDPKKAWTSHVIEHRRDEGAPHGHAGVDVGDIDDDGDIDIAFSNGWYENGRDDRWTWHEITDIYGVSNAVLQDVDRDGDLDVFMSAGHHGQGVFWFENAGRGQPISWIRHDISSIVGDETTRHRYGKEDTEHLHHPECLAAFDFDGDDDIDVLTCDLFFGEDPGEPGWSDEIHSAYLFENSGNGSTWRKHVVASGAFPNHLIQLVDLNADGRMDFISEATGYSVISYYENSGTKPH